MIEPKREGEGEEKVGRSMKQDRILVLCMVLHTLQPPIIPYCVVIVAHVSISPSYPLEYSSLKWQCLS